LLLQPGREPLIAPLEVDRVHEQLNQAERLGGRVGQVVAWSLGCHDTSVDLSLVIVGRVAYPLRLSGARLRHRPGRAALVALGVAAGVGALVAVFAGSVVVQDRSLGTELRHLDPAERTLRVTWGGVAGQGTETFAALAREADASLLPLTGRRPFAVLQLRESSIGGALVDLGGVEGLGRWVQLRSGRLPQPCTPRRCEVLQVGGSGALPTDPRLHLALVGSGRLVTDLPLGSQLGLRQGPSVVTAASYQAAQQPPILLAEGVDALSRFPLVENIYRTYSWVVPLEAQDVHPWEVNTLTARIQRASSELGAQSDFFSLQAPVDQIQAAHDSTRVASRRLLLIGGEAAALLLAFVLLAASSASREAEGASRRLTWHGATGRQLALVFGGEAAVIAVLGTLAGWAAGTAAGAALAQAAGSPVWPVLEHSVVSPTGLVVAAVVALIVALLLLASLWPRSRTRRARIGLLDVAAAGALAAVVLTLARGDADAETLARGDGTGVVLLLLPGLVVFVAAVVCMRALGPGLRLLERSSRQGSISVRLAGVSLARNPGRSAVAVAFLVVSLGLALFAATYRSTLVRNQADEAAFAVPLDFTLQENDAEGQYVLEAAPLTHYVTLSPGARAYPVLRLIGDARESGPATGTTILGVPAEVLPRLRRWRSDFAARPTTELARSIAPTRSVALHGLRLPEQADTLELPVRVRGGPLALSASIETHEGDFEQVDLGVATNRADFLRGHIDEEAHGGLLVALAADLPSIGHLGGDRNLGFGRDAQSTGWLTLGRFRTVGPSGRSSLGGYAGWIGDGGLRPGGLAGQKARLHYVVAPNLEAHFRPRQPTDGKPVPVIASSDVARAAGPGGLVPIEIVDQRLLAKVVATARRFPTLGDSFVVADQRWLYAALNGPRPRAGLVTELWLEGGSTPQRVQDALARPPFDRLQITSHERVQAELARDPLGRGVLITLGAAAIAALALALAGLLLGVVSDLRDERGELDELEAQGASPADLRRHLRLRALIVSVAGALGGLATGAVLGTLVVGVVRLTAGAAAPEPPLRLDVDFALVGIALGLYAAAAAAVVGVVTWNAFRASAPRSSPLEAMP
jgi:FtsX-like permease family